MSWYVYVLQVVSGALLTNGVPHFVQGLSGSPFQSPFASPSGIGESSPLVNVWWGFGNLAGGALLLVKFMPTSSHDYLGWGLVAAGMLALGSFCAQHFGNVRSNRFIAAHANRKTES